MKYKMHRQSGELQFVLEGTDDIPDAVRMVMDKAAGGGKKGHKHSRNGKVMMALVDCLNIWESLRAGNSEGGQDGNGEVTVIQGVFPEE